ncbi:hypothetical protein ACIF4Y_16425 [Kosakonia cowanii]|uniref:hypothetical protein n=1 Tax=Kosakonia cowanii TaxID=208223 RepID=UPI0021E8D9A9|nr:hypothetical protein [Kosakonia cowanii]MED8422545.1 hypothetical protein [Escherichia coli]HBM2931594.1 hypothetical protein [Klebsiella oxytoca]HBM3195353.1 hypothetical protein [Klebsiella michiganensis]
MNKLFPIFLLLPLAVYAEPPKIVSPIDHAPLFHACSEKQENLNISSNQLIDKLVAIYHINRKTAERVVSLLDTIPAAAQPGFDCSNVDTEYNNIHK